MITAVWISLAIVVYLGLIRLNYEVGWKKCVPKFLARPQDIGSRNVYSQGKFMVGGFLDDYPCELKATAYGLFVIGKFPLYFSNPTLFLPWENCIEYIPARLGLLSDDKLRFNLDGHRILLLPNATAMNALEKFVPKTGLSRDAFSRTTPSPFNSPSSWPRHLNSQQQRKTC